MPCLVPGFTRSKKTLPASLKDIRACTREVHPDKIFSNIQKEGKVEALLPNVLQVANKCILILNQLKEEGVFSLEVTLDEVFEATRKVKEV